MKVLVINCGSSSLKYELIKTDSETTMAEGIVDRVVVNGGQDACLVHKPAGREPFELRVQMTDHEVAMGYVLDALVNPEHGVIASLDEIAAVGHRVLHAGERFTESVLISEEVLSAVEDHNDLGPLHNPANLQGIRACQHRLPGLPMVAVFDTAFHQTMPPHAYIYGLPYELYVKHRVRRYGFHGTSHRYVTLITTGLLAERGIPLERQRFITCHLGNGCSMAAVLGGKCVDTSMGLTPLEGLLMGTRSGDLDPAVVPFLCDKLKSTPQELDTLMNRQSGLLGVSGVGSDMRDVQQAAAGGSERAALAVEMFCYRVRKYIGAYAAALGGLDALIYTAGIGENDVLIRRRCVEGLEFLGLHLDHERNENPPLLDHAAEISTPDSPGKILIVPTNEELMIARDTAQIVSGLG